MNNTTFLDYINKYNSSVKNSNNEKRYKNYKEFFETFQQKDIPESTTDISNQSEANGSINIKL